MPHLFNWSSHVVRCPDPVGMHRILLKHRAGVDLMKIHSWVSFKKKIIGGRKIIHYTEDRVVKVFAQGWETQISCLLCIQGFKLSCLISFSAFRFTIPVWGLCVSPFPVEVIHHATNSGFIRPERKGDNIAFLSSHSCEEHDLLFLSWFLHAINHFTVKYFMGLFFYI